MGIFSRLFGRGPVVDHALSGGPRFDVQIAPSFMGLASYADATQPAPPVPRNAAIQVPAVKRSRDLIAGTIGQLPLSEYDSDHMELVSDLLAQPEKNRPVTVTMTRTAEDLLFHGIAWWRIVERNWENYPRYVRRIDPWRVQVFEERGEVWIDGKKVHDPDRNLIRFDSPNDALLVAAARAIRALMQLDQTAAEYADSPQAREYFVPAPDAEELDDEEVREVLRDWKLSRKSGPTAYVPKSLKLEQGNLIAPRDLQLADARQHAVLEVARSANIDPEELGVSTTSRTYANQFDRRKAFIDFTLGPFMKAIEGRLSMGDVTKRGRYVRFNLDSFLRSDAKTRYETYEIGLRVGALDQPEIREMEEKPALEAPMPTATNQPESVTASRYDAAPRLEFTAPAAAAEFRVDEAKRTITGLVAPFGEVGFTGGRNWVFNEDSIIPPADVSRVKLLMDHSFGEAVGYATSLTRKGDGWYGTFQLDDSDEATRALMKAKGKVYDGLSVGLGYGGELKQVDEDSDTWTYSGAPWLETSLTPLPAFSNARVTAVAASAAHEEGHTMKCTKCGVVHVNGVVECKPEALAAFTGQTAPAAPAVTPAASFSAEQYAELLKLITPKPEEAKPGEGPTVVSATEGGQVAVVREELPYRFDRGGNFTPDQEHVFSADLHAMAAAFDGDGTRTEAGKRVMALVKDAFAVVTTNVNELNPNIQRPDMYVDQRDYRTPLWNFINKGAPPNGIQPFTFPKFSSASGLVGDHTEGVEPASGSFVTTDQTVTPTALSGAADITREVWDMGGNPAVSTLIWNQMQRGWKEGLETASATFLNTLTAAADLLIPAASADDALQNSWDGHLADLQFIRGYDFEALALEKELYKKFVAAVDADGRKLYPILAPQNANGTAQTRFRTLDLSGVTGVPSWALPSTAGSANNSWLFDPLTVHGWATAPQRLEFPGIAAATTEDPVGSYAPVAMIRIAIWGYKAFACSDIGGVRQVIYDTTA